MARRTARRSPTMRAGRPRRRVRATRPTRVST
nr:MAG TPA: hypothetical protein [Caudoviricetes sp.]